jgi:hypothetical protein
VTGLTSLALSTQFTQHGIPAIFLMRFGTSASLRWIRTGLKVLIRSVP